MFNHFIHSFNHFKAKIPARIGDLKISTRHCPLGTVLKLGLTGSRIADGFKTDDYCDPGQSDIDLTSLWCGRGFEGKNGVCNDINECEDPEICKGMGLNKRLTTLSVTACNLRVGSIFDDFLRIIFVTKPVDL